MCGTISNEMNSVMAAAYKTRKVLPKECKEQFDKILDYAGNNPPEFTAAGFFPINRGTVTSILGTLITFLVIMAQFDGSDTKT